MNRLRIVICANVAQVPFINNILPPLRAFQRVADVQVVEPWRIPGFVSFGGARPAEVPKEAVDELASGFRADVVVCLFGGLFLSSATRRLFPSHTVFAGFAYSDPAGLDASLEIAREFDLFYTQDPNCLDTYVAHGLDVRYCAPAVDPELYRPLQREADCDVIFFGKWTPFRDSVIRSLAAKFQVHVHAHANEARWSVPPLPPLNDPTSLCEAINRARLALEICLLDDIDGPFHGRSRITNRVQFAAACGVPSLANDFDGLREFFEPEEEIEVFRTPEDAVVKAGRLIEDNARRNRMGERARARVLREQTWDLRVKQLLQDVDEHRGATAGHSNNLMRRLAHWMRR